MEARKIRSPYLDNLKTAPPAAITSVRKILYGNNNYHTGINDITITPGAPAHEPELKRLTNMKTHFVSLASDRKYRGNFPFERVWASAKALGQYLKLNKLK
jgi:hypothetical protein